MSSQEQQLQVELKEVLLRVKPLLPVWSHCIEVQQLLLCSITTYFNQKPDVLLAVNCLNQVTACMLFSLSTVGHRKKLFEVLLQSIILQRQCQYQVTYFSLGCCRKWILFVSTSLAITFNLAPPCISQCAVFREGMSFPKHYFLYAHLDYKVS